MLVLKKPIQFLWDKGNSDKNLLKHQVKNLEAEEVFFDSKHLILKDKCHSQQEVRYLLIGQSKKRRQLFIVFTIRNKAIRIISARDLNKKEYRLLKGVKP